MSKMPVIFIGHGSPMNAIEENDYTKTWKSMVNKIAKPKVIVSISAHWYTDGTRIMNEESPKTIYDMYGFPKELYEVVYNSPGNPELAEKVKGLITRDSKYDNSWGIDHGTWSVLVHMYPEMDIPVFQVSIDAYAPPEEHYKIGQELASLRNEGVLIFASGNVVHNLRMVDWNAVNKGFDWAYEFDEYIYENVQKGNHSNILNYRELGQIAKLAVPTPDHFYPLLYALGATDENDKVSVYNKTAVLGSLTMTSYLWE